MRGFLLGHTNHVLLPLGLMNREERWMAVRILLALV